MDQSGEKDVRQLHEQSEVFDLEDRRAKKKASSGQIAWPGLDSEFYLLEKALKGFQAIAFADFGQRTMVGHSFVQVIADVPPMRQIEVSERLVELPLPGVWRKAILTATARAGLTLSGDLGAAAAGEQGSLIEFAISDQYLAVRREMGLR